LILVTFAERGVGCDGGGDLTGVVPARGRRRRRDCVEIDAHVATEACCLAAFGSLVIKLQVASFISMS
jgi:hypothetical protein